MILSLSPHSPILVDGWLAKDLAIHTSPCHQEPGQDQEGLEGSSSWWICISELVLTSKALGQVHGI